MAGDQRCRGRQAVNNFWWWGDQPENYHSGDDVIGKYQTQIAAGLKKREKKEKQRKTQQTQHAIVKKKGTTVMTPTGVRFPIAPVSNLHSYTHSAAWFQLVCNYAFGKHT